MGPHGVRFDAKYGEIQGYYDSEDWEGMRELVKGASG